MSCDISASRKVVGFLGHNATKGCNKCYKNFAIRYGEEHDFSGIDRENWVLRTEHGHRDDVKKILEQVTKTGMEREESRVGARYSVLLGLDYFDPIDFTTIDVMHNLYLGTAKLLFDRKGLDKEG